CHDGPNAFDIGGIVADAYPGAQLRQPPGDAGFLDVRAADGIAQVEQDLGDAAHSRAADADEMDALYSMFHAALPATCSQASAICCAAFRQACSCACPA